MKNESDNYNNNMHDKSTNLIDVDTLKKMNYEELQNKFLVKEIKPDIILESNYEFYKRKFIKEFKLCKF